MGLTAFARKAAREPFAALQLHAKRPRAAPPVQACKVEAQRLAGLKKGNSGSSGNVATSTQARSQ